MEFCGIAEDGTRKHESLSSEVKTQVDVHSPPVKSAAVSGATDAKSDDTSKDAAAQQSPAQPEGQTFSTFVTKEQQQDGAEAPPSVGTSSANVTAPGTTASSALNVSRDGSLQTQLTEHSTGEPAEVGAGAEGKPEDVAK